MTTTIGTVVYGPCACGGYGVCYDSPTAAKLGRCHDTLVDAGEGPPPPAEDSWGVLQEDLAALLRLLGLGDHARPHSPHDVMQMEVIPAVERLVRPLARDTQD